MTPGAFMLRWSTCNNSPPGQIDMYLLHDPEYGEGWFIPVRAGFMVGPTIPQPTSKWRAFWYHYHLGRACRYPLHKVVVWSFLHRKNFEAAAVQRMAAA